MFSQWTGLLLLLRRKKRRQVLKTHQRPSIRAAAVYGHQVLATCSTRSSLRLYWCVRFSVTLHHGLLQTDFCYSFLAELGADELSKVPFPMFCIVCGFYPLVVFLDGNRKSNFALRGMNTSEPLVVRH